ncbi:MAG: lipid-binding SYLF domain-containing protein [Nitrospiraceae bacterium]
MDKRLHGSRIMSWLWIVAVPMMIMITGLPQSTFAEDVKETDQILTQAATTWQNFMQDPEMSGFRDHVKQAKGVLIMPRLVKGAFLFGLEGGNGVLFVRDDNTEVWSEPAFYETSTASFGLQAGAESSEAILVVQTVKGIESLLSNSVKLGGDISAAVGSKGSGMEGSTSANLGKDFVTYSRSKGIFAGASFEGASIRTRDDLNKAYYGSEVRPTDIVVVRKIEANPRSKPLREAVVSAAGGK